MSSPGVDPADLLVRARSVLLDALSALTDHLDAVTVIGAQAVYLHTGGIDVALKSPSPYRFSPKTSSTSC